ncbi:heavy metal translocating P-type ATPase [Limnoraphis robusta]|uniref:Heavy metal translocating P-type ATPase n=1 Tax=Limnoraphis robusta CCNP1315 TaxID=3110306 RepID=A0ABU5TTE7_9CYAN|nr:heavy metal translocating P-type ATPase [Limnoraphis robusta]MEA5518180.1 heavy metal translocating P-type ATPase [Limnoraphis robusta CCNP1315]MEA5543376.1 heavy metal translocating P-type ATPase [Limnoraphis robusta CCNP1324]
MTLTNGKLISLAATNGAIIESERFIEPAPYIVHAVPGRVRFRVYRLSSDEYYAQTLEKVLQSEPGVIQVRINRSAASIAIHYQHLDFPDIEIYSRLSALIQQAGTTITVEDISDSPQPEPNEPDNEGEWSSLLAPTGATLLALLSSSTRLAWLRPLAWGSLALVTFPVAQRAFYSLFVKQKLNIDCLDLLALSLGGAQGKLVTPALVLTLHELGDVIREQTARSTEHQTADLLDTIGRFAWVERQGEKQSIPSDQVQPGEIVFVYPGEQIPVDGIVTEGKAVVDQQQLTGESMPIVAENGTFVYASTLVRSGNLHIKAERIGKKTRAAASLELLQKAPVHDTRMANYAANLADRLITPSLILAGIVFAATRDPARAASILTLDFVTGIRVSIPTAFLGALNHTTRHGILVRSGRTLEQLAELDTIVFDKTGTLTQGNISVVNVKTISGRMSAKDVIKYAAASEQRITHPVAEAIVRYAQEQMIEIPPRVDWNYEVGLGIRAEIEGQKVLVGSGRFLTQEGISLEGLDQSETAENSAWMSLIYVACNGKLQGAIQYADPLRPESLDLIEELQNRYGMEIHLLTGDSRQRADLVAEELNIPSKRVHAEAFPEQKAKIVRDLHRSGRTVAFVGDGLNDSVALAYADVSVSFEDGSDVARETADVVLMNNDISSLLQAIAIAKETRTLIDQNTLLVIGPNLVALGLASAVGLNPLIATVIHNGSAIAAGLNSLRPLVQHQLEKGSSTSS